MSGARPFYCTEVTELRKLLAARIWELTMSKKDIRSDAEVQRILAEIRALLAQDDKFVQAFFRESNLDNANDLLHSLLTADEIESYKHVPEVANMIEVHARFEVSLGYFGKSDVANAIDDMRTNGSKSTWSNPIMFFDRFPTN